MSCFRSGFIRALCCLLSIFMRSRSSRNWTISCSFSGFSFRFFARSLRVCHSPSFSRSTMSSMLDMCCLAVLVGWLGF